ncbi:MAG: thiamine pyrophosphate-binding protein [Gemmatimonadota bacterium]|nr:thiamine pyrophosphate-binding protein [Gemmatimonadota bacterium]
MTKLADYVIEAVAAAGVRHIFLLPGGGCMHLVDAVGRCKGLEFVANLHEQASAIAADAYGQYTNNLGVALVTTGPGSTNALTGVAGAWLDSTPCLFISGQVKRADLATGRGVRQMGFQEVDIVAMARPITKYAVTVTDPSTIRYHVERALYEARHGRPGPVWIDIPLDVQAQQVDAESLAGFDPGELPPGPSWAQVGAWADETIRLLNTAERPAILVGNGVRLAHAQQDFEALVRLLQVPVLTTWKAIDFLDEDDPLFAGRPGAVGQRGANFTQQNADWVLCLGARLDLGQTAYNHANFARAAKKIVVDVDEAEVRKLGDTIAVSAAVDAAEFLKALLARRDAIAPRDRASWLERVRTWKTTYPVVLPDYWDYTDGVSNYVLVDVLGDEMAADDLLVPGSSGACSEVTMQAFRVTRGQRIFNTEGLGPMGFGVPAAIGACLASDRRRTVCIDGDGGWVMNAQELEVIRRLNLPIKFFVLNNDGYASIRNTQRNYFDGRFVASDPSSGLTLPDVRRVAEAFGLPTACVASHEALRDTVREILAHPGPIVCEVHVSPRQATAPRVANVQRPDGTIVSRPMEDLFPFLDREELRANMLVPVLED